MSLEVCTSDDITGVSKLRFRFGYGLIKTGKKSYGYQLLQALIYVKN